MSITPAQREQWLVSDGRLAVACHPDEHAIAPMWSNARIDVYELALDLRDARRALDALEAEAAAMRGALVAAHGLLHRANNALESDGLPQRRACFEAIQDYFDPEAHGNALSATAGRDLLARLERAQRERDDALLQLQKADYFGDGMQTKLHRAEQQRDAALEMLRRLEWSDHRNHDGASCCPECGGLPGEPHRKRCALAALGGKQ